MTKNKRSEILKKMGEHTARIEGIKANINEYRRLVYPLTIAVKAMAQEINGDGK